MPFLVSLELRHSAVTELADVVFPVAAAVEKAGTFVDWEGRERPFAAALPTVTTMTDLRVLHTLRRRDGRLARAARRRRRTRRAARSGRLAGRVAAPSPDGRRQPARELAPGEAILATWSWLLDDGRMQDGEPHLAGTRKLPRLHLSEATAAAIGAAAGRSGEGRLRAARRPGRSRCRWSSPTFPTGWCGCPPRARARTCASSSAQLTATSLRLLLCRRPPRCAAAQEVSS